MTFTGLCLKCGGEVEIHQHNGEYSSLCLKCGRRLSGMLGKPSAWSRIGYPTAWIISGIIGVLVIRWFLIAAVWLYEEGGGR